MPINPEAVGSKGQPTRHSWDSKDAILYALGVGAGAVDPLDELAFTTENTQNVDQQVLPTMAVVLNAGGLDFSAVGKINLFLMLHGEQGITLHRDIPVAGTLESTTTVTGIWDKGKGAVIEFESVSVLADTKEPLFTNRMSLFARGEGGWGGDRGPTKVVEIPDRAPDRAVTYQTRTDQALLYRLNGDRNPLHSDPTFAKAGGFDRPILHGLCTYGFTGRALLHELCDGDPARFGSMDVRFSSPVMPGEALTVKMWDVDGGARFQTFGQDGRMVLDAGVFSYR